MEIYFKNSKLKKQCEDPKKAQKGYGARIGNMLTQRVGELSAATSLLDINQLESINIVRIEEVTDYHGKQKSK